MKNYSRTGTLLYLAGTYTRFLTAGRVTAYPYRLQIQTNSVCNGRCLFCPYPETSRRLPQGRIKESLFRKIIDELSDVPYFNEIVFELHNEPLLDDRTFRFIEYVKNRRSNIVCNMATNGQLIDKISPETILRSGIDRFIISVNAFSPETYKRVSGGFDYEKLKNNIELLMSDPIIRAKIQISYVATRDTVSEINRALKYWKERAVSTRVIRVTNRAGVLIGFEALRLKNENMNSPLLNRAWQGTIKQMTRVVGCHKPFLETNILYNGDVLLCCHDWNRTTVLGNLKDSSLEEIWNSPRANEIRNLVMRKQYSQIPVCKNCSEID